MDAFAGYARHLKSIEEKKADIEGQLEDVRHRWREDAKKYHPDMGGNEDVFKALNNAYSSIIKRLEEQLHGGDRGG
jgi:hypothetical protein